MCFQKKSSANPLDDSNTRVVDASPSGPPNPQRAALPPRPVARQPEIGNTDGDIEKMVKGLRGSIEQHVIQHYNLNDSKLMSLQMGNISRAIFQLLRFPTGQHDGKLDVARISGYKLMRTIQR